MTATTAPAAVRATDDLLLRAGALFALAVVLHNADHVRRGVDAVSRDVLWVGTAAILLEVGLVVLIAQRHRVAPLAAAVAGASLALGYLTVHFLPQRSWLSDSFTSSTEVSALSWSAGIIETVAATGLAVVGVVVLARRGGLASASTPHPTQRTAGKGLRHPVALAFALSQVVVLGITFAQL